MKNPNLVAKISLTILAAVLVIMFLAAVVIPNMVEASSDEQAYSSVTTTRNSS